MFVPLKNIARRFPTRITLRSVAALPVSHVKRFCRDNRGQDLVEYALIVAFAVGVVAVLTALYTTIKSVLTKANNALQSAAGQ